MPRPHSRNFAYLLLVPTVIVLFITTIYPLIYSLNLSLHSWNLRNPAASVFVGLENYLSALRDPNVLSSFRVTFTFVISAVSLELIVGLGIAILLNRELRGGGLLRTFIVLPMMMPPIAVGLTGTLMLYKKWGVINQFLEMVGIPGHSWLGDPATALAAVVVVDIWQWSPFVFLILLAGLQSLPLEIYEAAKIDGASGWQMFRFVTLPLLKPVIMVAVLLRTMDAFKTFDTIYMLTRGGPGTHTEIISLFTYRNGFQFWNLSYAATLSWLILVVIIILSQIYIRFYHRSLA